MARKQGAEETKAPAGQTSGVQNFINWLIADPPRPRSFWSVIIWWERRRLAYNAVVLGIGFVSYVIFLCVMSLPGMLKPGEDAVEPLAVMAAPILFNIAYCAGPVTENIVGLFTRYRNRPLGPSLMMLGVSFSLILVGLPTFVSVLGLMARAMGGSH